MDAAAPGRDGRHLPSPFASTRMQTTATTTNVILAQNRGVISFPARLREDEQKPRREVHIEAEPGDPHQPPRGGERQIELEAENPRTQHEADAHDGRHADGMEREQDIIRGERLDDEVAFTKPGRELPGFKVRIAFHINGSPAFASFGWTGATRAIALAVASCRARQPGVSASPARGFRKAPMPRSLSSL